MAPVTIDQVDAQIKRTIANIEGMKNHIQGLEDNLSLLRNMERALKQNMSILKDDHIVAMASEFKKVKQDLKTVEANIDTCSIDLKNGKFFLSRAEKLLIDLKDQHDILSESHKSKVLTGHFGKE